MNYLLRSRVKHPYRKRVLVVVVLFVLGAAIFSYSGGTLVALVSPLWKGDNLVSRGLASSLLWIQSKDSLVQENRTLLDRVVENERELAHLRTVAEEEERLLEILGRVRDTREVLAGVLARPPESPYDTLVIDAGSDQGLKIGDRVRLPEGSLLGRVAEVWGSSARVLLYSASGEKINVVLERNGEPVVMEGRGGGNFSLALPRDMLVVPGDRILSSDVFSDLVAVVKSTRQGATDSFKEVLATSPANIFSLRYVVAIPR